MKKAYISFDGKVFEKRVTCIEYEYSQITEEYDETGRKKEDDFEMYDHNGNKIYLCDESYNIENNLGSPVCFLVLKTENAVKFFSEFYDFDFKTTGVYCRFFTPWLSASEYTEKLLKKVEFIKSLGV